LTKTVQEIKEKNLKIAEEFWKMVTDLLKKKKPKKEEYVTYHDV